MGKIKNPILFSEHFGISAKSMSGSGLIDPFVNVDTPLFIDPTLLAKSSMKEISGNARQDFVKHFSTIIELLMIYDEPGDPAWKAALKLLNTDEPAETGLGYGSSSRSGASRPKSMRAGILSLMARIVQLGTKNPDLIAVMAFLEDGVGSDTISDITTNAIIESLCKITNEFCAANNVPTELTVISKKWSLPIYKRGGTYKPIVLTPKDIVKRLPLARDWSEIENVILANEKIRREVNVFLGGLAKTTVSQRKRAIRKSVLKDRALFEDFLSAYTESSKNYDPARDIFSYYKIRDILRADTKLFFNGYKYDIDKNPDDLMKLVKDAISHFKDHVENKNLWEELWDGDKPKLERSAQLLFYAISDVFCKANDVDISPEAHMGGGPVDFKFSRGYRKKVLVEIKRSGGNVVHGYEKQLEIYKKAAGTDEGVFLIVDFGDIGSKLTAVQRIRNQRLKDGQKASEIIVIDATKKTSASKR